MTIDRKMLCSGLALALLSGCTANDPGMGDAVRANQAAQIIEPDPQYAEAMTANGDQTAGAQERYRKGSVKQPAGEATTSGVSGGGSSGGN
jgi:type IV pilus biogenesis protein CpaD/CtpE